MARRSPSALIRFGSLVLGSALGLGTVRAQPAAGSTNWLDSLHLTAGAEAAYTENISRTSTEPTRKDAASYKFDLASSIPRQLAPSVLLVGSGELSTLFVDDYELNNNVIASGRLRLQKKFGLGAQAWVVQATAGAGYKAARLDDDRGWTIEGELSLAKRVLPNLRFAANLHWLEHDAASFVFDVNQVTYGIDVQWDLTERWTLSGNASWLEGDIVANAAPRVWSQMLAGAFGPTIFNYYTSRPSDVTDLYGPGWVSYNVEADANLWSLTLTYVATAKASLALDYATAYVVNKAGVAYPSNSWTLRLDYRF